MFVYISPDWKEMQELQTQTQETGGGEYRSLESEQVLI